MFDTKATLGNLDGPSVYMDASQPSRAHVLHKRNEGDVGLDRKAKSIQGLDDVTRTQMILTIDPNERSWKVLLQKESLRKSSSWNHITFVQSGNPYPQLEDLTKKEVKNLSRKVSSLTFSNAKIKKDLMEERSVEFGAKEAMKGTIEMHAGLEKENARLRAFLESSEKKLAQSDELLVDALERLNKATDEAVIETRGKIMQEYLLGQTNTWEAQKDIDVWE
ncbi:hypothetical protein LWI29_012518 [Acer saccharum]|uniref:Uncharacterized protein n=1 Tax=Acer saccharum TaxID=4024 RepID=A0AA39TE20_ACESA|nr:hypothetical protein LWI29_012518 [Acer saccharum]